MSVNSHVRTREDRPRRGIIVRCWLDDWFKVDFGHYTENVHRSNLEIDS